MNTFQQFYIRPDAVQLYEEFVDVFEFFGPLDKQPVLYDIYYDEISSGLMVSEVRRRRQELLESLSLYYRVFILKEDMSGILEEDKTDDTGN